MMQDTTNARMLLSVTAHEWGIPLSSQQLDQFDLYTTELLRWNAHTNLTTLSEPYAITIRHFLDSLALARVWPHTPPESLADVGTGAGFPGLPLKLLWPDLHLLLIESVGKKTAFLQHMIALLRLTDVEVCTARAEEVGQDLHYRERYAAVTGRAVAALSVLAEYCLPLCRVGGVFVAPKGMTGPMEARAAQPALEILGGQLVGTLEVLLPELAHTLIIIHKVRPTPPSYPRRAGKARKRPL